MNDPITRRVSLLIVLVLALGGKALAQSTTYISPVHVFSIQDIQGDFEGLTYADDPSILCIDPVCPGHQPIVDPSGVTLHPMDNAFTFDVIDFVGAFERARDALYEEGLAGNVTGIGGAVLGLRVLNVETSVFKAGSPKGTWCAGLGGNSVKCSSEHHTSMEHVLTCDETVPYLFYDPLTGLPSNPAYNLCQELEVISDGEIALLEPNENSVIDNIAVGSDYAVTVKDDGKPLYRWGTLVKRPTDVRLYARIPLPAEWKVPGAEFEVLRAELILHHLVTNNPNDQVRPEDFENEAATGQLPRYVVQPDGRWTSAVDCYEGDGHFMPAGTVLRNPPFGRSEAPSADLREGWTNAWYTTIDRDPFAVDAVTGVGPRWRLQSNKFGQDIPALEIPVVPCSPPPFSKSNIKYPVGDEATTVLNLLDWQAGEISPLALSSNWNAFLDGEDGVIDGLSPNGLPLTEDFDLGLYVKGEGKPATVFDAQLVIEYR